MKKIVMFVLFFCLFCNVSAGEYYVSPIGSATWSQCTNIATPCSLAIANVNARAGDIVYLRGGVYSNGIIEPVYSGNSVQKIIFSSYNDEPVVFDGLLSTIAIYGKEYVKVHGINVTNSEFMLRIMNGANHTEISYCNFYNAVPASNGVIRKSLIQANSHYNWIHDSIFHSSGYAGPTCDDIGGLITVGTVGVTNDSTSHNLIEKSIFYHGGHHLVEVGGKYNVVRNNFMHNEGWMDCSHCAGKPALCGNRNIGGSGTQIDRNLFEGNVLSYGGVPPDNAAGSGLEQGGRDVVRYNRIYKNSGAGIMPYQKVPGSTVDYNHMYSNTIYQNAVDDLWNLRGGFCLVRSYYNSIKNNIIYENGEGFFCDYNEVTWKQETVDMMATQIIKNNWDDSNGDPLFVDPAFRGPFDQTKPDLRLQSESGAIDYGAWLTVIESNSGSGSKFIVNDSDYFIDGWGIVEGDVIQLQGSTRRVQILNINYDSEEIIVNESINWVRGQGVSLLYEGTAPDAGAYEYISGIPTPPLDFHKADLNSDYKINLSEVGSFIGVWRERGVSLSEVIVAIRIWSNGECYNEEVCGASATTFVQSFEDEEVVEEAEVVEEEISIVPESSGDEVLWLKFDGDLSDSANDYDAICTSCPITTTGKIGTAYRFDGDDYLDMGDDNIFDFAKDFSISLWFKSPPTGIIAVLIGRGENNYFLTTGEKGYYFVVRNDSSGDYAQFSVVGLDGSASLKCNNVHDNLWHHFVAVREENNFRLYCDDILAGTQSVVIGDMTSSNINLFIGRGKTGWFLKGVIDDIRVWDRALSEREIKNLV